MVWILSTNDTITYHLFRNHKLKKALVKWLNIHSGTQSRSHTIWDIWRGSYSYHGKICRHWSTLHLLSRINAPFLLLWGSNLWFFFFELKYINFVLYIQNWKNILHFFRKNICKFSKIIVRTNMESFVKVV